MARTIFTHISLVSVFMPNSHFDNVLTLYRFDGELKMCVFSAIQKLEVAMRAKVIYHFSMKHGPFWFMDKELADKPTQFEDNLERLRTEVSRSYEDFIKEHFVKYDEPNMPPAWKTLEVASFGTLSKLYRNCNDAEVKKRVADDFGCSVEFTLCRGAARLRTLSVAKLQRFALKSKKNEEKLKLK